MCRSLLIWMFLSSGLPPVATSLEDSWLEDILFERIDDVVLKEVSLAATGSADITGSYSSTFSFGSRLLQSTDMSSTGTDVATSSCIDDAQMNEDFLSSIGLQCHCKHKEHGIVLFCLDHCIYCNDDGTSCGIQSPQALYDRTTGQRIAIGGVFQYTRGSKSGTGSGDGDYSYFAHNDDNELAGSIVAVENTGCIEENDQIVECTGCNAYYDGQKCNSCELITCDIGYKAEVMDCQNIYPGAEYNFCDSSLSIQEGPFQSLSVNEYEACLEPTPADMDVISSLMPSGGANQRGSKKSSSKKSKKSSSTAASPASSSSSQPHNKYSKSSKASNKSSKSSKKSRLRWRN